MKSSYRILDLVADAKAAGLEVTQRGDEIRIVKKRHRGTGKIITGVDCLPHTGWCLDPSIDLAVARAFRATDARRHLGLRRR